MLFAATLPSPNARYVHRQTLTNAPTRVCLHRSETDLYNLNGIEGIAFSVNGTGEWYYFIPDGCYPWEDDEDQEGGTYRVHRSNLEFLD